ncbi:Morn repeat protein [Pandoravirus inopinatum]|uniref:Morn repeat protein n=1 Tax=Pandoravirus inopinatum TaxID=1605721 RepID=A0A0B5J6L8_9VIRU|nr:Morn repeat protein [Pandoravirus inopinatum]AJF97410.1 Morn repeat protein [Pandoravirus inopinatum]
MAHCKIDRPFDRLPDELILKVLQTVGDPKSLGAWSLTSRRHHRLALDESIWRRLCEIHFGPSPFGPPLPPHVNWRWIYRAQSHPARRRGRDVGALKMRGPGVYWGATRNGRPHGFGVDLDGRGITCNSILRKRLDAPGPRPVDINKVSRRFQGRFVAGKKTGLFIDTHDDGCRVERDWNHDDRAAVTLPSGIHYEGGSQYDEPYGRGLLTLPNSTRFKGHWHFTGSPHGNGIIIFANGDVYSGSWRYGARLPVGTYMWAHGGRYDGELDNADRMHKIHGDLHQDPSGGCTLEVFATKVDGWRTKRSAGGDTCHYRRCGQGTLTYADGSRLTGMWDGAVCTAGQIIDHSATGESCPDPDVACMACKALAKRLPA